jgi:hypothetical protein
MPARTFLATTFLATFGALLLATSIGDPAVAGSISSSGTDQGKVLLSFNGPIAPGDADRLKAAARTVFELRRTIAGIRLSSPGGDLAEAFRLAGIVREGKMPTIVPDGSICASACFVVFAAGSERSAGYGARVGVHGASDLAGHETVQSGAATITMARAVKELGVPPGIIGKMVVTPPGQMVWLTPDDLQSMGTKMTGTPVPAAHADASMARLTPDATAPIQEPTAPGGADKSGAAGWDDLMGRAVAISSAQNGGRPRSDRLCQPELSLCTSAVFYRSESGNLVMVKKSEDMTGTVLAREVCTFDGAQERVCVDWDSGAIHHDRQNAQGRWQRIADQ